MSATQTEDPVELEERLRAISKAIGRAKAAGRDPRSLIEQHRQLQEQYRLTVRETAAPLTETYLEVLSSPEELRRLQPQFDDLLEHSSIISPFLKLEWLLPWHRHFGGGYDLHVAVVREGPDRLLAAAPLMLGAERRPLPLPLARFLGTGPGLRGNYFSLILRTGAPQAEALLVEHLRALLDRGYLLRLEHLSPFGDGLRTLELLAAEPGRELLVQAGLGCVYGCLPRTYEEFIAAVPSPQRRNKLRQRDRDLCDEASARYEVCEAGERIPEFLDSLRTLNSERRRREGVVGTWEDDVNQQCRLEVAESFLRSGGLRLEWLLCGDKPIATLMGFVFKGRYFCYNIGMAQRYARFQPGHLLLAQRIEKCIAEGLSDFNFLVGDVDYKRQYFRDSTPELSLSILPARGRARLLEGARLVARGLRRRNGGG